MCPSCHVFLPLTPAAPLFSRLQFKEFLESNGTLTFSWYRGDWPTMDPLGSAPGFRFTVINPALLPAAAGGGSKSRIEFVFDPTYELNNNVPVNTWVTHTVSLSQGKLWAYMGSYANTLYGKKQIDCYEPLSFWVDPAARCKDYAFNPPVEKQHPWLNPTMSTQLYGTDDIVRNGIIWEGESTGFWDPGKTLLATLHHVPACELDNCCMLALRAVVFCMSTSIHGCVSLPFGSSLCPTMLHAPLTSVHMCVPAAAPAPAPSHPPTHPACSARLLPQPQDPGLCQQHPVHDRQGQQVHLRLLKLSFD